MSPGCRAPPSTQERDAAAGDEALLDRRLRRVHRVFDARLLLLHLGFGGRTDLDHRHASDELHQPLLQLLAIVVRGCVLGLRAQLPDAPLDRGGRAAAFDNRRSVLVDRDLLGRAEICDRDALERDAQVKRLFTNGRHSVAECVIVVSERRVSMWELKRSDIWCCLRSSCAIWSLATRRIVVGILADVALREDGLATTILDDLPGDARRIEKCLDAEFEGPRFQRLDRLSGTVSRFDGFHIVVTAARCVGACVQSRGRQE